MEFYFSVCSGNSYLGGIGMDIGYFLDMMDPGALVTVLFVPLIVLILVVVWAIIIICKIVSDRKADKMDPNVRPADWAENRNEEKDVDN
jgi:L-asparagine transporter-like permease